MDEVNNEEITEEVIQETPPTEANLKVKMTQMSLS